MPIQFFYNGSELEGLMFTREKSYLKPNFDKESDMDDFLDEVRDSASDYFLLSSWKTFENSLRFYSF